MKKQFTATCYVFKDEMVLLIYHHKFQKWMPPGGHVEPTETPQEAAVRECFEETGLKVQLFDDSMDVNYPHAKKIARPYLCLLENIPSYKQEDAHQHIDFIFMGKVIGGCENGDARWFSHEDLLRLKRGEDIFEEVLDILSNMRVFV